MKSITPEMEYLSTRQSAKVLQVSLGTVQKMVELGELIAWKTRGGHRRILASSLDQQLQRRKRAMRQKTTQNCIAVGIIPPVEQVHLIHYLSKNKGTQRIPILVDAGFMKLHPGVVTLVDENSGGRTSLNESIKEELENGLIELNPLVIGYPATTSESNDWIYGDRHGLLEPLFLEALARKCA